jgi:hypothetical protein
VRYENQQFENMNIILDENEYIGCQFKACNVIYRGGPSFAVTDCTFDNCGFLFESCAAFTLGALSTLYKTGLQSTIESVLETIRGGGSSAPPTLLQ